MAELKDTEEVSLYNATGRISAETIFSNNNLPLFSRSQVDGSASIKKLLSEEIVKDGTCIEIYTGSIMPYGSDAVYKHKRG